MAKKKEPEAAKGSPAWMATFSDLMNLLLCFFVLLFSMSSVSEEKFNMVIASLQSKISIFDQGGLNIGEGDMIGGGIRQLEFMDAYYNELANSKNDQETETEGDAKEQAEAEALAESEEMAENVQNAVDELGISNAVEIEFDEQYVMINLSGAILFESGQSEVLEDAVPVLEKIALVLNQYDENIIEIEGHTDNVPVSTNSKYESNDVLSMYRALSVADLIREKTDLNPAYIKSAGRGDYVPVADNGTPEGRARNRRVVIKIYNSYSSHIDETGE
ncbi:MAG: flagellar motor protein MotB [Oscillospiraceae bacterium]|nr:flagellar motor protein MotB [Oscillospiraceae bacterium]